MHKHRRDTDSYTSSLSSVTGEKSLTGGTIVTVTPEKVISKKKKNIKSLSLSPFLPGNKILLNKENNHNPETTDTSRSEKDDMSHTCRDDFISKVKDTKSTTNYDKYKEGALKHQYSNESVDNPETFDNFRDGGIIKTTK